MQQPVFILLEVNGRSPADRLRVDAPLFTEQVQLPLQRIRPGSPPAADAERQNPRNELQRAGFLFSERNQHVRIGIALNTPQLRGALSRNRIRTVNPDGFSPQHRCRNLPDALRLQHGHALAFRPEVDRESSVEVRRRGNDRRAARQGRDEAGQFVCPAEMAGQKRDHKAAVLIHTQHGGVFRFAPDVRRHGPQGDPRCADEDQRFPLREVFRRPGAEGKALSGNLHRAAEFGA